MKETTKPLSSKPTSYLPAVPFCQSGISKTEMLNLAHQPSGTGSTDKVDVIPQRHHDDLIKNASEFIENNAQFRAANDELNFFRTIKTYPIAAGTCLLSAFGALSDGFQLSIPGSIIANQGFINQFGTDGLGTGGAKALDPQHVAAWGG